MPSGEDYFLTKEFWFLTENTNHQQYISSTTQSCIRTVCPQNFTWFVMDDEAALLTVTTPVLSYSRNLTNHAGSYPSLSPGVLHHIGCDRGALQLRVHSLSSKLFPFQEPPLHLQLLPQQTCSIIQNSQGSVSTTHLAIICDFWDYKCIWDIWDIYDI